jgi:hypothetical protein
VCEQQTQMARHRLWRFCQRPIHRKAMRTHARRQRHRVDCPRPYILKWFPHKLFLLPPHTSIPSGHNSSSSEPPHPAALRAAGCGGTTLHRFTGGRYAAALAWVLSPRSLI